MTTNALATTPPLTSVIPSTNEWSLMLDMARQLVPTGFLPEAIKKPEQAVAIMLKGRELRVPPMYALSNIAIVKGKPTVSAEMMLALIYRDYGKAAIRIKESTNDRCVIQYRTEGWDDIGEYAFTIKDAERAGLANGATWRQYPAAMLRARCISAVARMAFPECIAGMYVPGELGDEVYVDADGVIHSAEQQPTATLHELRPRETGEDMVIEVEGEAAPVQDWDAVNRRAHAVMVDVGGDHADLHNIMVTLFKGKYQSIRDLSVQDYDRLMAKIDAAREKDADAFTQWITQLRAAATSEPPRPDETVIVDADAIKAIRDAERRALETAKGFGWNKRTVNAFAEAEMGSGLANLSADGLTQLAARLAATTDAERDQFMRDLLRLDEAEQRELA